MCKWTAVVALSVLVWGAQAAENEDRVILDKREVGPKPAPVAPAAPVEAPRAVERVEHVETRSVQTVEHREYREEGGAPTKIKNFWVHSVGGTIGNGLKKGANKIANTFD